MNKNDISRPFENEIWVKAKKIAERYNIRITENILLGYVANSIEMPTVWADGMTLNACLKASITAHTVAISTMLEFGEDEPPIPMKDRPLGGQEGVRVIPCFLDDMIPPLKYEAIDKPFDKQILTRARLHAEHYTYGIETSGSEGSKGECFEIETVCAKGEDEEDCLRLLKAAVTDAVADILWRGEEPPMPGSYMDKKSTKVEETSLTDDVTKEEESSLKDNICPDCSGVGFIEGPCGGGSVNVTCANSKCKAKFNFIWPFIPQRITYGKAKLDALRSLPPVLETPPMPKCKPPKEEALEEEMFMLNDIESTCDICIFKLESDGGSFLTCSNTHRTGCTLTFEACCYFKPIEVEKVESIQDRLTANAEDFDGIIVDILTELATIQTCRRGHKFVAKSHEYVCPLCLSNQYLERINELRKRLEQK